ncbi:hypothetical protein [Nostocoides sp. Soil756]|jgi:hypothetical protein|uniref:hypothetical protein n=1 Tax=Nostocoides sp. Soil756 TaxID=1736399 RepID=UPI0006F9084B|nr:hypothetical protein [Tetrasphaera sp. Soil756]KRE60036.1 hypothetical protein ASG78_15025 [Tetrasphaera sp. Soil756]
MTDQDVGEQVRQMIMDIDQFIGGTMTIDRLSNVLKIRLAAMEASGADFAWVAELRSLRNQIEYVNAFWLESGCDRLGVDDLRAATEAADELRAALVRV